MVWGSQGKRKGRSQVGGFEAKQNTGWGAFVSNLQNMALLQTGGRFTSWYNISRSEAFGMPLSLRTEEGRPSDCARIIRGSGARVVRNVNMCREI